MPEEVEEQVAVTVPDGPVERPRGASLWRRLLAALFILAAMAGAGYLAFWSLQPVSKQKKEVLVEIPRNFGSRDIAGRLRSLGLIRSEWTFLAAGRVLGDLSHLKAGEYELDPSMTPVEILDKLARGDVKAYWITVPEGATGVEIGRILGKDGLVNPARFATLARQGGLSLGPGYRVPGRNLEGYLFPDTYKVPKQTTEREIIRRMIRGFDQQVTRGLAAEIAGRTNGLDFADSITLASLVEKEARLPAERARIAGVLVNRLKRHMHLECDATVQYALGYHKKRLLYKDLEVDSPYNTYKNAGLPPGPICNPGTDSIRAALRPERNPYLYYVADGKSGGHLFSRTFDEHRAAIRKVRAAEAAAPAKQKGKGQE